MRKERKIIQEIIWFDRYKVLSVIGQSAGSTVYLVRHQKLGEYRAVKRIPKEPAFAWQIREADILNHLKHPQIPTIYDIEEDEEYYYIVEEYVVGESLEAWMLQSSFVTLDFIYHTILEVANILDYLHHRTPNPLIYQDLKPEHIKIGKSGIKLIDFGIAAYLNEAGEKFQNYGTAEYCAPEKFVQAKISVQTDVFSIGKLLEKLIAASADKKSQCLMHIARKAAHKDAAERYPTMKAFKDALKEQMQSKENPVYQKHLLKKIIVAGSQSRVGSTHVAISLTVYLNRQKISTVYLEKNSGNCMQKIIRCGGFAEEGGLYRRGDFIGMPEYGAGVTVLPPENVVQVLDYGADIGQAALAEGDLYLLVLGSRMWEEQDTFRVFELLKEKSHLVLVANYGDGGQAKRYARDWKRNVYSFPLDAEPFHMTKEKARLFAGMLAKEGGGKLKNQSKSHWNCRKYPGKRRDPFSRCIGKLCSQRLR